MSRALVTFATGPAEPLLEIARPRFKQYAVKHGYEFFIAPANKIPKARPASWYKVMALVTALHTHSEVLWLDADVLILDDSVDLADEVPADAWQAMVAHHTPDGEVPNHGVWLARTALLPTLQAIWGMEQYIQHPWWEQAAGCDLLGYDPWKRPMTRERDTELHRQTCWLGTEWNSHRDHEHPEPRFWHATVRGDRERLMREKLDERTRMCAANGGAS